MTALAIATAALQEIAAKRGKTMLAECCVHRTCSPLYDDGELVSGCKFQGGVNRGFSDCGEIAADALRRLEDICL